MSKKRTEVEAPELLTVAEVAKVLRCPLNRLYLGRLRRQLPWVKIGASLRLRRADLDAYLAKCTQHAA